MHEVGKPIPTQTAWMEACANVAWNTKQQLLNESTQMIIQQQMSARRMATAWRKRQRQCDSDNDEQEKHKKQRTCEQDEVLETFVCLPQPELAEDEQTHIIWLCGEGHWE